MTIICLLKTKKNPIILDAGKNVIKFRYKKFVNTWAELGTHHFPNSVKRQFLCHNVLIYFMGYVIRYSGYVFYRVVPGNCQNFKKNRIKNDV